MLAPYIDRLENSDSRLAMTGKYPKTLAAGNCYLASRRIESINFRSRTPMRSRSCSSEIVHAEQVEVAPSRRRAVGYRVEKGFPAGGFRDLLQLLR